MITDRAVRNVLNEGGDKYQIEAEHTSGGGSHWPALSDPLDAFEPPAGHPTVTEIRERLQTPADDDSDELAKCEIYAAIERYWYDAWVGWVAVEYPDAPFRGSTDASFCVVEL